MKYRGLPVEIHDGSFYYDGDDLVGYVIISNVDHTTSPEDFAVQLHEAAYNSDFTTNDWQALGIRIVPVAESELDDYVTRCAIFSDDPRFLTLTEFVQSINDWLRAAAEQKSADMEEFDKLRLKSQPNQSK